MLGQRTSDEGVVALAGTEDDGVVTRRRLGDLDVHSTWTRIMPCTTRTDMSIRPASDLWVVTLIHSLTARVLLSAQEPAAADTGLEGVAAADHLHAATAL